MYHGFDPKRNYLRFRISPDIAIAFGVNIMGTGDQTLSEAVEIVASRHPGADEQDAYERVLGDAMDGDATLFARQDYVDEAWRIVDPVLKNVGPVHEYEPNTWGPSGVDQAILPPGGWANPMMAGSNERSGSA
jgi:glucose-6-phosphate 1-dehydrogenase